MHKQLLFSYRPPVRPRPARFGTYADTAKISQKGNVEGVTFTDIVTLPTIQATDSFFITDNNQYIQPAFIVIEPVTESDISTLAIAAYVESALITDSPSLTLLAYTQVDSVSFSDSFAFIYGSTDTAVFTDTLTLSALTITESLLSDSQTFTPPAKAALDNLPIYDQGLIRTISAVEVIVDSDVSSQIPPYRNIEGIYVTDVAQKL